MDMGRFIKGVVILVIYSQISGQQLFNIRLNLGGVSEPTNIFTVSLKSLGEISESTYITFRNVHKSY